ncbi:hypothetical protein FJY68_05075 [candidate division WOR-3 bacterium]|uniref:Peptidase S74 domain-containing protein n=1 Tax=candidate division WOR-3 bacterium TaxID=2052148 RepID=A0A938BPI4_UNCW3|nr:hypothetical protein [candidate division WOR-3 bacterium]
MRKASVVVLLCVGILFAAGPTMQMQPVGRVRVNYLPTGVPQHINLQGYLTDTTGNPINGSKSMRFDIFRGGSSVWNETQTVDVDGGLFSVVMGSTTPIPYSVFEPGTTCELQLTIGGQALSPRVEMTSVGHAYRSVKSDTAVYALSGQNQQYVDSAGGAVRVGGLNLTGIDSRYVNEGQSNSVTKAMIVANAIDSSKIATDAVTSYEIEAGAVGSAELGFASVTSAKILDGTIAAADLNQMGATTNQVIKWTGSAWAPRNDSLGAGDNTWMRSGSDSVLYTVNQLGLAKGGASNLLYGTNRFTHVNFGVSCTTGASGQDYSYATVSGGYANKADGSGCATVGGGNRNAASGQYATVGGGDENSAGGRYATVPGGNDCIAAADYSFAVGDNSEVVFDHGNSAAFNGQTTTASGQTRVGILSKASGSFTIDHPLDPRGKILNHYFVESPDMSNVYSGSVVLSASGRGEVSLPDYFDALNRNPRVQLTGVGTTEVVYVAEDINGNRFVVGGKPGAKVYWQVTGDRKDPSAEITRIIMPVEQPKTGQLAGHSLDDDFLRSTKGQLERMGAGGQFSFRTAEGRKLYERIERHAEQQGGER